MRLVEVIVPAAAGQGARQAALTFARQIEKLLVRVNECPDFLVHRIQLAGMLEAFRGQDETGATLAEVDATLKVSAHVPMGPFTRADMLRLDMELDVAEILERAKGDRSSPTASRRERVQAGRPGAKADRRFYEAAAKRG